MGKYNKTYRIRTEVGKDTHLNVKLEQEYDVLELMSLKIDQQNAYKLHTSDYGVIAGRVLANGAFGIPNAKISVFINIDDTDINDVVKSVLYPYNTTNSKDKNGVRYNLLSNEQKDDCHTVIGTFPEKQYVLDNDNILEIFEKYYKYTTRTNNAGDYMIFGVPVGSQTIHVDIDLSDIGILSQKPRDMVYKGYDINQFENPNKFKYDTNLNSLVQVISQDSVTEVIPFWGDEDEGTVGITRCDIDVQYKFEPTCVFMGSVVSDTASNSISKKCIPSPGMGAMDEITTGSGTIEMIRKKPDGTVEEFQIQGTQLINGDGIWCYQIPMNLDYMMTDEFGNMVPTNDPNKGIPTRTKVRFRLSMQDFDTDSVNMFRGKMLIPHNPKNEDEIDYQFGTNTKDESYRDLFWNGVYSVKSYIPRIQKGSNWKNEKFTGFKRVNYYGDKNPIPYNNIRIRIPFMYTILCVLIKALIRLTGFVNWIFNLAAPVVVREKDEDGEKSSGSFISLNGELCNTNMDNLCIIPGVDIQGILNKQKKNKLTLLGMAIIKQYVENGGQNVSDGFVTDESKISIRDEESIDDINKKEVVPPEGEQGEIEASNDAKNEDDKRYNIAIRGMRVTDDIDYLIQCVEMNLAQEYRVIQFDFYNDWINGLVYIPRWMRNISKKRSFLWGLITFGGKVKACNENFNGNNRNIVQQCALSYNISDNSVSNPEGCVNKSTKLRCHKNPSVRKKYSIFKSGGLVSSVETSKSQYVYYFKPLEVNGGKNVHLFSTDIILLGSLNSCDKWGIPQDLQELTSSSYQIPPNLALTDSDLEGNDYGMEDLGNNAQIVMKVNDKSKRILSMSMNGCYEKNVGIRQLDEYGNYTEISGIDWGYEGPLQTVSSSVTTSKLYKPGGHFLGLTCRNSESTIKSCVNLSRVCEYGVWMSQRHSLNIPTSGNPYSISSAFRESYATVPAGIISKDEISDNNYRTVFATMNHNNLKTYIDESTGYPIYDFAYVKPTNFGGELNGKINSEKVFNRLVKSNLTEQYYEYTDDDYYKIDTKSKTSVYVSEKQIMRLNDSLDKEYFKFRFGLTDSEFNSTSKKKAKYLQVSGSTVSFPMYDNSFYFYFGLKDGATALDEFKKQFFSVCRQSGSLIQKDTNITLGDLQVVYDGTCSDKHVGKISFKVRAHKDLFEGGITVTNLTTNEEKSGITSADTIEFTGLSSGTYQILVETNDKTISKEFSIIVDRISINAAVSAVKFTRDVSKLNDSDVFTLNRKDYGGYIEIEDNVIIYNSGSASGGDEDSIGNSNTTNISLFDFDLPRDGTPIHSLEIKSASDNIKIYNSYLNPKRFTIDGIGSVDVQKNNRGNYMIPVHKENEDYTITVNTFMKDCKPYYVSGTTSNLSTESWSLGTVRVSNAIPLNIMYNDVSYSVYLDKYASRTTDINTTEGWWIGTGSSNWSLEPETVQWKIKEALYMNEISTDKPHVVSIVNSGGLAPYTEIVKGMKGDFVTTTGITRSDFENVFTPTLNFASNGKRRGNFSYQIMDVNEQKFPENPFIFPVIYKPFFMEMGVWYFDSIGKYYLIGNVYNGKTWNYKTEGFNNCKLNTVNIANFATITKSDQTMEIDEPLLTSDKGGYGYMGPYFKYNGRKVFVSREVEPITYGLHNNGNLGSFVLTVGCEHNEVSGSQYADSTEVRRTDMEFCSLTMTGKTSGGKYLVKFLLNNSSSNCNMIAVPDDAEKGYVYPLNGTVPNLTGKEKLFRDLMDDKVPTDSLIPSTIMDNEGFIDITSPDANGKIYYIVTPQENSLNDVGDSAHSESKLKAITISGLINLGNLKTFYPLDIEGEIIDIRNEDGSYKTQLTIKPADENSKKNFNEKTYVITFYRNENNIKIPTQTLTLTSGGNTEKITVDITAYRDILGLGVDKVVYFYYDVYKGSEKSPTTYLINETGTINCDFIDKYIPPTGNESGDDNVTA